MMASLHELLPSSEGVQKVAAMRTHKAGDLVLQSDDPETGS
jgi:hypothetical protein